MFKVTRKTHAKFVYSPFSAEQMTELADAVRDSVILRIKSGINCEEKPAKPLKPGRNGKLGYPDYKSRAGIPPIRNWISQIVWPLGRIKTLRALKVKTANENRAVIGFVDPKADLIAHFNNKIDRQFGMSPVDKKVALDTANAILRIKRLVRVVRERFAA